MARREYKLQKQCAHPGCAEIGRWTYETAIDLERSFERRSVYRCLRHTNLGEVLGGNNKSVEKILTCVSSGNVPGRYWDSGGGFVHGPGFKAWATDFPEGTRLIVTVRVEQPE